MASKVSDLDTSDIAADLAALRADVARLSDTLSGLARSQMGSATAAIKGAVKGAVGDARNQMTQASANAQDGAFGLAADLERRIEGSPLTAVLIAAGVGIAVGMMSKSRA